MNQKSSSDSIYFKGCERLVIQEAINGNDNWLTLQEASKVIGKSENAIRLLISRKRRNVRTMKVNGKGRGYWIIHRDSITHLYNSKDETCNSCETEKTNHDHSINELEIEMNKQKNMKADQELENVNSIIDSNPYSVRGIIDEPSSIGLKMDMETMEEADFIELKTTDQYTKAEHSSLFNENGLKMKKETGYEEKMTDYNDILIGLKIFKTDQENSRTNQGKAETDQKKMKTNQIESDNYEKIIATKLDSEEKNKEVISLESYTKHLNEWEKEKQCLNEEIMLYKKRIEEYERILEMLPGPVEEFFVELKRKEAKMIELEKECRYKEEAFAQAKEIIKHANMTGEKYKCAMEQLRKKLELEEKAKKALMEQQLLKFVNENKPIMEKLIDFVKETRMARIIQNFIPVKG